jgi:sugar (pentulose or hexulose) kinase
MVSIAGEVHPDAAAAKILDRQYARYRKIYPALRSIYSGESDESFR